MNYFGHAACALAYRAEPLFCLGAMLPDLAGMTGVKLDEPWQRSAPATVREGMNFHLRTDAAFHELPRFLAYNQRALRELAELGIRKGPARAMAHMGVEFLIDAELARDEPRTLAYVRALQASAELHFPSPCEVREPRYELGALLQELAELGSTVHVREARRFELRFGRALKGRARLEPSPQELSLAVAYFAAQDLRGEAELLLEELLVSLG